MNEFPNEIQEAFRAYHDFHADAPELSPDFMPRLWNRIEERRSPLFFVRRIAGFLVAGSVAAAFLMTVFLIPHFEHQRTPAGYYADVVARDNLVIEQEYAAASLPFHGAQSKVITSEDLHK